MAERVASDHPSVTTLDATITRRGRTRRPELHLPAKTREHFPLGELVRLVIMDAERYAPIECRGDTIVVTGAFETPRLANHPETGTNYLAEWLDATDRTFGRTALVDVIVPEFRYGLRVPGDTAVYDASQPPADSLRRIAASLDDTTANDTTE